MCNSVVYLARNSELGTLRHEAVAALATAARPGRRGAAGRAGRAGVVCRLCRCGWAGGQRVRAFVAGRAAGGCGLEAGGRTVTL